MAHLVPPATTLNGRRFPRWKRRLIASVAALLVLSALLGETEAGHAAVVSGSVVAPETRAPCSPGVTTPSDAIVPAALGSGQELDVSPHRAQPGPVRLSHALAGVPPWVIWPASPLPRIAGAFLQSPIVRTRIVASAFAVRDICAADHSEELFLRPPGATHGWPEPFSPLDRFSGTDQRFPRPPPR